LEKKPIEEFLLKKTITCKIIIKLTVTYKLPSNSLLLIKLVGPVPCEVDNFGSRLSAGGAAGGGATQAGAWATFLGGEGRGDDKSEDNKGMRWRRRV